MQFANRILFFGYIALLGGMLAHFSIGIHPRFLNQADAIDSQAATLERRPFVFEGKPVNYTSWRSRVLVPYSIEALAAVTGLRFSQSYVLIRWISASLALAAFALLAARQAGGGGWYAAAAAGLFALTLFPTFLFIYETPTDFTDAFFFSVLTLAALEKRRLLFTLTLLVGVTNRESAVFALAVWWAIYALEAKRTGWIRETAFCAAVGIASGALVLALRLYFALPASRPGEATLKSAGQPYTWHIGGVLLTTLGNFFRHPYFGSPIFYLLGYTLFFTGVLWVNRARLPPPVRRAAVAAAGLYIFSIPFANLSEIRVYIPSLVLVTFATVVVLREHLREALTLPDPAR